MIKIFCILILCLTTSYSKTMQYKLTPEYLKSQSYMSIKILDVKELNFEEKKGVEFSEISDLAYKNGKLFAVSDRGYLYKFDISFKNNKIDSLVMLNALRLKTKKGKVLKKKKRDSEGLTLVEDKLLISFERKHRVVLYNQNAVKIQKINLNTILQNRDNYLKPNKGLEAVAFNKKYGVLTAPERPLKNKNDKIHTIYTKNSSWSFKYDGSITSLEFMDKDKVLVLLRKFDYITRKQVITLLKLDLSKCTNNGLCNVKILAILDSSKGWHTDNFEGLTKVSKDMYLMVSDDNGNFFQKTLLVLFEVMN